MSNNKSNYKNQSYENNQTKYVPVHNINVPGGGIPEDVEIEPDDPVHSSYTGNLVGYGNIPVGVTCDAPPGHKNYGKKYHAIIYNPANDTRMIHRLSGQEKYASYKEPRERDEKFTNYNYDYNYYKNNK